MQKSPAFIKKSRSVVDIVFIKSKHCTGIRFVLQVRRRTWSYKTSHVRVWICYITTVPDTCKLNQHVRNLYRGQIGYRFLPVIECNEMLFTFPLKLTLTGRISKTINSARDKFFQFNFFTQLDEFKLTSSTVPFEFLNLFPVVFK